MTSHVATAEEIGTRIAEARARKGLTQHQLSTLAELSSASAISNYEKGVKRPSIDTLSRLAMALEVSERWLLCQVDEP